MCVKLISRINRKIKAGSTPAPRRYRYGNGGQPGVNIISVPLGQRREVRKAHHGAEEEEKEKEKERDCRVDGA